MPDTECTIPHGWMGGGRGSARTLSAADVSCQGCILLAESHLDHSEMLSKADKPRTGTMLTVAAESSHSCLQSPGQCRRSRHFPSKA